MALEDRFDAVLMLTWSDWDVEPRSNRYHYASRFAKKLPVLFFQHRYKKRHGISVRNSEIDNLEIVDVTQGLTSEDVADIKRLLRGRGIVNPLVWIYDTMNYGLLIEALPRSMRVYHATEDYLTETKGWNQGMAIVAESVVKSVPSIDFIVFVSEGIVDAYYSRGGYSGPAIVIRNGCDAEFFIKISRACACDTEPVAPKQSVIFQGGINQRIDYGLLARLIKHMPDWEFKFCGASMKSDAWEGIIKLPNVKYYGAVSPEEFARYMCDSSVGIIPYIQDEWIKNSLPLKAYEYVACGLPVVTVPIAALDSSPELFFPASTVEEFERAIRKVGSSRNDAELIKKRQAAAMANSYNNRFREFENRLLEVEAAIRNSRKRLRVAFFYDAVFSTHVSTIREHLEAFDNYSMHDYYYIPATPEFWAGSDQPVSDCVDLSIFDVAIVHYSTRLSVQSHLDERIASALERFNGLKLLFIQDEYEGTEIARAWMDRIHFDIVYTCVPPDEVEKIYPSYRFPATSFLPTLTGYVPEDASIEVYARPLVDRKTAIAYRGRKLPAIYGNLGQEKYRIGAEVKRLAQDYGLEVDIEVDDSKRIYGSKWYEFLGAARATLGTESGANIFDFDGMLAKEIKRIELANPSITYEEIHCKVLRDREGAVSMNQISPKIFEAIRLRTALILFEGSYSNIVKPDVHFIPLKKDFSNFGEVVKKLLDDNYILKLTDRAYRDIVDSGLYSYQSFVQKVDVEINARTLRSRGKNKILAPLFYVDEVKGLRQALPILPKGVSSGPHPLGNVVSVTGLAKTKGFVCLPSISTARHVDTRIKGMARKKLQVLAHKIEESRSADTLSFRSARRIYRMLPAFVRTRLVRYLTKRP